jgi:hypothetical protein
MLERDNVSATKSNWIVRLYGDGKWAPLWMGLSITISYLLLRCAFDGFYLATWGFPEGFYPLWRSDSWWTELVNGTLLGYIPAALMVARRGIDLDFRQLQPRFSGSDAEVDSSRNTAAGPPGPLGRALILVGAIIGFGYVFVDPSITEGAEHSLTQPIFVWRLFQTAGFIGLFSTLTVKDINATRSYFHLGRNLIEVDLLDVQSLAPFARRGLRSALTWVIFSIIFSLFWINDQASQQNLQLLLSVLAVATAGFMFPLIGVHNNILAVKSLELDRLRDEIRVERKALTNSRSEKDSSNPKLANLVAYHQLIDSTREWPIDAANLLRFCLYLLIGLGSWLGGAIVERLLDSTLGT